MMPIYQISFYDGAVLEVEHTETKAISQWEAIRLFLLNRSCTHLLHTIAEIKEGGQTTREVCFDSHGHTDVNAMEEATGELALNFYQEWKINYCVF